LDPHFERKGIVGVIDRTIGKSDGGFLYAPHCDHCAVSKTLTIRPQFAIECL